MSVSSTNTLPVTQKSEPNVIVGKPCCCHCVTGQFTGQLRGLLAGKLAGVLKFAFSCQLARRTQSVLRSVRWYCRRWSFLACSAQQSGHSRLGLPDVLGAPKDLMLLEVVFLEGALGLGKP